MNTKAHVEVLSNGVDEHRFRLPDKSTRTGRARPLIVHIGRARPEKNRKFILKLASSPNGRKFDFDLYGSPTNEDLVGEAVPPNVRFMGVVEDVPSVLREADLLILPSVREGLPGVVLEALATGVPVIASDIPALRELAYLPGLRLLSLEEGADTWGSELWLAHLEETNAQEIRQGVLEAGLTTAQIGRSWIRLFGICRAD